MLPIFFAILEFCTDSKTNFNYLHLIVTSLCSAVSKLCYGHDKILLPMILGTLYLLSQCATIVDGLEMDSFANDSIADK